MNIIDNFRDDPYSFMVNSFPCDIELDGRFYPSVEHAFQAAKTLSPYDRLEIANAPNARAAKRLGRQVSLVNGWDNMRVAVMREFLEQKFDNPQLAKKLVQTGQAKLVSGADDFWGNVSGNGENNLGKLLMEIRQEKMQKILGDLKDASRDFLAKLGWKREPQGDDLFDECWVKENNPDCYFDLESALVHQLKVVTAS